MADRNISNPQNVTNQGRFVTPLDNPRSFDYKYTELYGAAATSGTLYDCTSGRWAYVHQLLICEHSGVASKIRLVDPGRTGYTGWGAATPWIPVDGNSCVAWQPCGCPLGPFAYSGNFGNAGSIDYYTDGAFYGGVTLIVQIDPKMKE